MEYEQAGCWRGPLQRLVEFGREEVWSLGSTLMSVSPRVQIQLPQVRVRVVQTDGQDTVRRSLVENKRTRLLLARRLA